MDFSFLKKNQKNLFSPKDEPKFDENTQSRGLIESTSFSVNHTHTRKTMVFTLQCKYKKKITFRIKKGKSSCSLVQIERRNFITEKTFSSSRFT